MSESPGRTSGQWESKFASTLFNMGAGEPFSPQVARPVVEDTKGPKRGRRPDWEPMTLTETHVCEMDRFMAQYGTSSTGKERVLANYLEFCRMNGRDPKKSLAAVIGQMLLPGVSPTTGKPMKGLSAGTIDTYSGYVYGEYRSAANLKARRAAMRYHADADCEGAARYSREYLLQTLLKIQDVNVRRMCLVLWLTGLRPCAVRHLRRKLFKVGSLGTREGSAAPAITVEIRLDKIVKKRVQRSHLVLPWAMVTPIGEGTMKKLMGAGDPNSLPFAKTTCDKVNAELKKVAGEGEVITSYCFRKAFVSWVFEMCKGDMVEVKKYTLHFTDQVIKAHYVDWFKDTAQDNTTAAPIEDDVADDGETDGF